MACRAQKLFLIAGIFGLILLGKPAKVSASTVDILTSNVEDLAAVGSPGETNGSRADLPAKDKETQLPADSGRSTPAETANSVDRTSDIILKNRQDACFTKSEFSFLVGWTFCPPVKG